MYVVAGSLESADFTVLEGACAELGLAVHASDPEAGRSDWPDVILAALHRFGDGAPSPSAAEVKRRGGYPIAVLDAVSATGVLAALSEGFSLALASPLRRSRLVESLGYLKSVAPPVPSQVVTLDGHGRLGSPSKSVPVTDAESGMLRCLADRPGQIVSREELTEAADGEDANKVASVLKQKLDDVDSGAKILKVPHLGFRLVGTVQDAPVPESTTPATIRGE
jgi:DNA-binding winged helix-turn-helix (wHTH) protein